MITNTSMLTIKNNMNLFIWFFSLIWCSISVAALFTLYQDWLTLDNTSRLIILSICFFGMLVLIPYSFSRYLLRTVFDNNKSEIIIIQKFIYTQKVYSYKYSDIEELTIVKTEDSEGSSYYNLTIVFNNSDDYILDEGHNKEYLEKIRNKIIAFIN